MAIVFCPWSPGRPRRSVGVKTDEKVTPVNLKALELPQLAVPLRKGVHAEHEATLSGLDVKIDVTADSGAQVPAVSLSCASKA